MTGKFEHIKTFLRKQRDLTSLRTRLLITLGLIALCALIVSDIVTYSELRSALYNQADSSLESVHPTLEQALDSGDVLTISTVARLAPGMFVEIRNPSGIPIAEIPAFYQGGKQLTPQLPSKLVTPPLNTSQSNSSGSSSSGQALSPQIGGLNGNGSAQPLAPSNTSGEPAIYFTASAQQNNAPQFRVRASSLINGYQLILAEPLTGLTTTLSHLMNIEELVTALALIVALIIGWRLVIVGLKPLSKMEAIAAEIADGDLSLRVPDTTDKTEVGRLSSAFNHMIERIQQAFIEKQQSEEALRSSEEKMRRFVADASHELRTPLAAVSAYAQLFELGAQSRPEDLERVMKGIQIESKRMSILVEELMLLARLDEGRPLAKVPVELVSLCAQAVESSNAIGPQWRIDFFAASPVEVIGDPIRIRQVVDNLLTNIRTHTPMGTKAYIRVSESQEWGVIEVQDNGPGISAEQSNRVFERFFRLDSSRSRTHNHVITDSPSTPLAASGSGLGLSIVQSIVQAHGGSIELQSPSERGTLFVVKLPLRDYEPANSSPPYGIGNEPLDPDIAETRIPS